WNACSTCHDGLLAVVTSASQGAVLSGAVPPETRHHSRVVVVSVEYSSRTLPRCWQLCRKCTLTPPGQHCASWSRSRSETSRGTRKKLQRRKTGHPPDTLHPICRRLRGVQQYMGRHPTMQRGYPGMVERHGARTERRQNTVRPHPRAKGGVSRKRGFRLFGLHDQTIPRWEKLVKIPQVIQDHHQGEQKQHSHPLQEPSRNTQKGTRTNRGSDNLCASPKDYRLDSLLSQSKQCRNVPQARSSAMVADTSLGKKAALE